MVEFGILGPIEISVRGEQIDVGGSKRRGLVGRLAIDVNRVVPLDSLVDDLWSDERAAVAPATIYTYVSRLRKIVGPDRLLTRPPGYMLVLGPGELDAEHFETLVALARSRGSAPEDAIALLEEAERLWRGPALAEFGDAHWARPTVERLERARLDAVAERLDALLRARRAPEAAGELEELVEKHHLDERFWRLLVLANYRCGRQADALRAYQRAREALVDELGIEPGAELRALEHAVLSQDASLDELEAHAAAAPTDHGVAASTDTITVVLTDIEGSTELWDRAPAAMAVATVRAEKLIADCVVAAGGRFLKSRGEGDATFSAFQLASNAVRAADDLQQRLTEESWPEEAPIRVRVAVNTGEVFGRDSDYFGTAVNRAARLRALAAGGQVVVGASTAALTADALRPGTALVPVGSRELRGLRRHEDVFLLTRRSSSDTPETSTASDLSWAPPVFAGFVGRRDVLHELDDCVAAAKEGQGRLVLVRGEPGVGKTRLLAEFARRAAMNDCLVLYGRCDEGALVPYQPFVAALAPALRAARHLDLGPLTADLSVLFPDIPGAGAWPVHSVDAESRRLRLFEAIDRALGEVCKRGTVVLLLEDLHWADGAVLLLLRHLARSVATRRVMIAATYRSYDIHPSGPVHGGLLDLRRHLPVLDVELAGISEVEVGELLMGCLGSNPAAGGATMARRLHRDTAGNALFVTEVVRDLMHRRDRRDTTALSELGSLEIPVPNTVAEVVAARVAELQPPTQRMLTAAAVVGTTFDPHIVIEVAALGEDDAIESIEEALTRGVIVECAGSTGQLGFSHAVVRRAVYGRLAAPRRARLHREVALAMQRSDAEHGGTKLEELARHFLASAGLGDAREAIRYARLAGARAIEQLSYETGIEHYRHALGLLPRERAGSAAGDRCEVLLALADALNRGGDAEEAKEALLEAAAIGEALNHPRFLAAAALAFGGVIPAGTAVTDERAVGLLRRALDALEAGDTSERALVCGRLAQAEYWVQPREARVERCAEAVAMARRLGDPRTLASVLINRYWALDGPDDVAVRLRSSFEVERLAAELDDLELALQGGKCRLHVLLSLDAWAEAIHLADQLRLRALELRQPEYERLALSFEAVRAGNAGRFEEAEELASRARTLLHHRGQRQHANIVHALQLLPWRWLQGRLSERIDAGERILASDPDRPAWRALLAWVYAECDQPERAAEQLERVDLGRYVRQDRSFDFWMVTLPSAIAVTRLGDRNAATLLYDALQDYSERNGFVGQIAFFGCVEHHLGALAAVLERDGARAHLERASARHHAMGATAYAAQSEKLLAALG